MIYKGPKPGHICDDHLMPIQYLLCNLISHLLQISPELNASDNHVNISSPIKKHKTSVYNQTDIQPDLPDRMAWISIN